jgi:FkbM family methyltransferase
MLGGREPSLVLSEVLQRQNYVALWRMLRRYPGWGRNLGRYFFGWGDYPYRCRVRTPRGEVAPTLYSHHDIWTVNEVFCREDYAAGAALGVAVDIGSNIGISALYFLTRNDSSRCYLYEPVPVNVERLKLNLEGFAARYELSPVAVAARSGRPRFGVEPTGRYGGIGLQLEDSIEVECRDVNDVLAEILEREERIDILKLDTEGEELPTVQAIRPELLARIDTIYFEWPEEPEVHRELFEHSYANTTCVLRKRAPAAWDLRRSPARTPQ